ncbi:protein DOG1-like 3 [Magnolia sinica]|uniref:protein DOG1-like 3 n=1 Tax=Magnolia sinica TaxID=86752 RepID=UPI0026596586|nr:protein DOG1-like 3 [Magnolia sinica]
MSHTNQERFHECYNTWVHQQELDLENLLHALHHHSHDKDKLSSVVTTTIHHYQDYYNVRSHLARLDAPSFFYPTWCTSFENSFLWIAECRPSMTIRLVYSLSGLELEAHLDDYLQGARRGDLADLSPLQLSLINDLHRRTIREEDKLSSRMASLQDGLADQPLLLIAAAAASQHASADDVERAMEAHSVALACILEDADKLRINTLKEMVKILTPLQAVDLLVAAKQLHFSVHEWGKRRDRQHGRN